MTAVIHLHICGHRLNPPCTEVHIVASFHPPPPCDAGTCGPDEFVNLMGDLTTQGDYEQDIDEMFKAQPASSVLVAG